MADRKAVVFDIVLDTEPYGTVQQYNTLGILDIS